MNTLVTGGAGYIGSHAVRKLLDHGHAVAVLDNLSHGHRDAVDPRASLIASSVSDEETIVNVFNRFDIDAILHFAADIEVSESVEKPLKYYHNNFAEPLVLLAAARTAGIRRFVFSSTAAVYGTPTRTPIEETAPLAPINPYGRSKMMMEFALQDCCRAYKIGYTALRYFNVAGAHPDGTIGEDHRPETHLIPKILSAAQGKTGSVTVFGTDYPTPDGTCVRDYVHVEDLVYAHLLALEAIEPGQGSIYNLGSENGFSVREVIRTCEKVTGRQLQVIERARRPGDPPVLVASSRKISHELGWQRRYPELETIIRHAWNWHTQNPKGYLDRARSQHDRLLELS